MSANRPSRHHGFRGYGAADHDRLKRALLLPVQSWERKWQYPSNGKNFKVMKWVKGNVATPTRLPIVEDTPTPTASIIQPPTEASTPQPSETEPDTASFLRPLPHLSSIPKSSSLLREASLTSAVSTPGETITTNNNNTPRDVESSLGNSPEMEGLDDDEEQMDDVIASQSIPQKNKVNSLEFEVELKQVNENIDVFKKQSTDVVFSKNQDEYIVREKSIQNDEYVVLRNDSYNRQTHQVEDYDIVQVEDFKDYNENNEEEEEEEDDDDDYGERADEYDNQDDDDYSEYGSNEFLGRTSEFEVQNDDYGEPLSDFDDQPHEYVGYGEQQVGIKSQISEFPEPQNPYQEQKVNEFTEQEESKNTKDDDIEQGQFNIDTFGQNI
ncbi:13847_t:CDS:2 [Funneliformis geosporum]|uniref:13847_t:CDS:1 n=1 Tax=Funneliformis geosporum TaxID=1117311 RepID=A0A9W4SCN3_9GLOM|nr:13847_t:CDS:2 [Funneliformis geosporum]